MEKPSIIIGIVAIIILLIFSGHAKANMIADATHPVQFIFSGYNLNYTSNLSNSTETTTPTYLNLSINSSYAWFNMTTANDLTLSNLTYTSDMWNFTASALAGTMKITAKVAETSGSYYLKVDGSIVSVQTSSNGIISFSYSGWSSHNFSIQKIPGDVIIITKDATGITAGKATLNGATSNINGSVVVWFQYGSNPLNYLYKTPNQSFTGNVSFSSNLNGMPLMSGKTYYYKATGVYNGTIYNGVQMSFTLLTLTPTTYDFNKHFANLTNSTLNPTNMSYVGSSPFIDVFGNIFWGILFALIFIMIWVRQEDITIPALLGLIIGASLWSAMPSDWTSMAMSLTVVSFAGLLYSVIKGRG